MKIHWRVWVLIIFLVFSFMSMFVSLSPLSIPAFEKGVVVKNVDRNSAEFTAGLRPGMIIKSIDSTTMANYNDFIKFVAGDINGNNVSKKRVITLTSGQLIFQTDRNLDIAVASIPKTKLKTGLDLSGGARALIKPANVSNFTSADMADLVAITTERFNIYGLKDIVIKPVTDLQGNNYLLIEIAGATPDDLEELVAKQGKFEGKIGNHSVFLGGKGDIANVERTGQRAGIEGCSQQSQNSFVCRFTFPMTLTENAAKKQADITKTLSLSSENPGYLSEKLDLYVDEILSDSLLISKDLQGRVTTEISISGSGVGTTQLEAVNDAEQNMKKLQTILITGSLPYKLEIVKLDTISPNLGKEFTKNLIILGLVVFALISLILFIRYRKIKITSAVILTMFSEAFITLGLAALIGWNLDAPGIAGIIAGMGTGVNDQIVIIDESVSNMQLSLKERIKRAFFIIVGAFFTIVAAMVPLFWAGAGMLKGFALTTILSVIIGITITRPAFAEMIKRIQE